MVVVFVGGIDVLYLFDYEYFLNVIIVVGGVVVSEMFFGWKLCGWDFLCWNWLILGVLFGVIVIEVVKCFGFLYIVWFVLE